MSKKFKNSQLGTKRPRPESSSSEDEEEYASRHARSGTVYVHTNAYSGGTMSLNTTTHVFSNVGGVVVGQSETLSKYCSYSGGPSDPYLDFGYLYVDLSDGSVIITTTFIPLR